MIICPKCKQTSTSEKFCTNCWADLTAKADRSKSDEDKWSAKQKNILILGTAIILGFLLISMIAQSMIPSLPDAQSQEQPPTQATVPPAQ